MNFSRFLIVANGPFLPEAQLKAFIPGRTVVALDGAADRLKQLGVKPDVILGDFDSLQNPAEHGIQLHQHEAFVNEQGILIVPAYDQNQTDLQKAIDFCDAQSAQSIDIVCATDGRFDHAISNIRVLKKKYRQHRLLVLHVAQQSLIYLKDESYEVQGKIGDMLGLFGFPHAVANSQGLKYELTQYVLDFAEQDSSSNQLTQEKALIEIKGEALLVGPMANFVKANNFSI
jgi:thiamine pyrophosphokinase